MAKTRPLASMLVVAVIGCGGGGDDPPDAGPDGARPPDAAPDAPPGATTVTFRVFSLDGVPEANDIALISDNGGTFRPMTAGATGVYTADVVGPRYAIARGCSDPGIQYTEGWIYYLTLAEATELADLGCHYQGTSADVSGTLTGVAADQRGAIITSYSITSLAAGATDYTIVAQPVGTTDLVARLFPDVPTTQPRPTERLLIERDLGVPGPLVHDLDFTADGFAPEAHTFDVTGAGGAPIERISSSLLTQGPFGFTLESNRQDTNVYHTIPADRVVAGDRVTVTRSSAGATSRSITMVLGTPADISGAYGPAFSTAAPTLAATAPIVRLAGSLPHVDGADIYEVDAFWFDENTFDSVNWSQVYTSGYAGAAAIDYEFPDLTGIGGWDIGLPPGEINWTHSVISSAMTDRLPTFLDIEFVVGDTILGSATSGALQP